jgi:hypothetical protein
MYKVLYQRTAKIETIAEETKFSVWYQHNKNKYFLCSFWSNLGEFL